MYADSAFEGCPISDELLGRIYRAGPDGVETEVSTMSLTMRARLAAFCYARAHLHEIGLAIAATCDQRSLTEAAGRAGEALYARSSKRAATVAPTAPSNRRAITLAKLAPIRAWTVIQGGLADPDDVESAELPTVQCSAMSEVAAPEGLDEDAAVALPGLP
jgi:hypothetical protein